MKKRKLKREDRKEKEKRKENKRLRKKEKGVKEEKKEKRNCTKRYDLGVLILKLLGGMK